MVDENGGSIRQGAWPASAEHDFRATPTDVRADQLAEAERPTTTPAMPAYPLHACGRAYRQLVRPTIASVVIGSSAGTHRSVVGKGGGSSRRSREDSENGGHH